MAVFVAILMLLALLLIFSLMHLPLYSALLLGLLPFVFIARREQTSWQTLFNGFFNGLAKLSKVYQILFLIGAATALWMACGTLPFLIHAGIGLIHPRLFLLLVFLITWGITLLLGSALGSAGMVGALFMAMAGAAGYSLPMTAGAVVSAIYLGERSSPLSSCANLVADVTQLSVLSYIKVNMKESLPGLLLTVLFYTVLSLYFPMSNSSHQLQASISNQFSLTPVVLLPVVILILGLIVFRRITLALLLSIISAIVTAVWLQNNTFTELARTAIWGYTLPATNVLAGSLKATGILGMLTPILTVMASALYSGLFESTALLKPVQKPIVVLCEKTSRTFGMLISSIIGSAIGCSQTFAIIFAHQLVRSRYTQPREDQEKLGNDIANTAVLMPALIPWNAASSIPASLLGAGFSFIPFAVYLYLSPLCLLLSNALLSKRTYIHPQKATKIL